MNLIAFDTSTDYLSLAISTHGRVFKREAVAEQKHSQLLLPWLDQLLSESGITLEQVDAIAYGSGPGSFTGLRIGAGIAQGLALGCGKPLLPVGGLLALAEASGEEFVVAGLDARMGQVYLAAYRRTPHAWTAVLEPGLHDLSHLPALPSFPWVGIGNGFDRCPELARHYASSLTRILHDRHPCAEAMCRLASAALLRGEAVDAGRAELVYLRDKVAQTLAERGKL